MTASADDHSESEDKTPAAAEKQVEQKKPEAEKVADGDAGKALATAASSPVNPFLAAAASEAGEKVETTVASRSFGSRMLDYSAHAAIIVGLVGFAWTVSDHVINRPTPGKTDVQPLAAAAVPAQTQKVDEMAQLRQANLKMHEDIKALKTSIDAMRAAMRRDTTSEQVRMLSAGLENVKASLGTMRSDTTSAIAQLNGKVDKLQPGKMHELNDRLGRLEHQQATDQTATGSIGKTDAKRADIRQEAEKAPAPTPPVKPAALAKVEETRDGKAEDKPQVIAGMYVRDVYRGVALIEGRRGTMEVVPGTNIPGAGVVKSIERHNGTWTVVTSKGEIAFEAQTARNARPAGSASQAPYGYGRGGGYSSYYRYGY